MAEDPTTQPSMSPDAPAAPAPATAEHAPEPDKAATTGAPVASALPPVAVPLPDAGYTPGGVPTLDGVRDKIETRYGTALGATELAEETPEGRTAAQQFDARQKAAADRLEEIRASMHKPD
jgi:hypothetical protein